MNIQSHSTTPLVLSGRGVTAILGPTNTGKTHLAIERLVAHGSGVIGLPLRLLAREVYGRVCAKVGAANVALITGEEKIAPPTARFQVCTVEAMPRQTDAAFVAIDEVQLAGDLERGHIFTDRLLHLRGRDETLLLGAATMRGILEKLLPGISVVTRPRMSHLAYDGSRKITRLPRRSAVVAFSSDEVYAIAELIRRQRGGAAVVLGALSPRTRNAQVDLYQSGDVDYLIATDAIGMGLNLDVDHVAFAQNRKYDGFRMRDLTAAELGQIAGRAGRHTRDGTFGVTGQVAPFADTLVENIEAHDFEPVRVLQWRTAQFDFSGLDPLRSSIDSVAPVDGLTRALPAVDVQALDQLMRDSAVRSMATTADKVELLWDACQLPDYRKIAPAQHADIIGTIFNDLARTGHVDEDYMAEQVRRSERTDGDIDTLSHRIAQIRTWTFVSHRPGWLADPTHWQEKTRSIEDSLSDALHERLTKRFVDRRTSVLMKRLRENSMSEAEISASGDVLVEGHHVGQLQGFRFTADAAAEGPDAKAVKAAAQKALAREFEARSERIAVAANGDLALGSDGVVRWLGGPVASLAAGEDGLVPRVILLADEQLTGPARDKVAARVERFVSHHLQTVLKPLFDLKSANQLSGIARGVAFQLVEHFGLLNRRDVAEDIRSLDQEARGALRRLGVRFGFYHIFVPVLLKPAPAGMLTLLWALQNDGKEKPGYGEVVGALSSGRTSVTTDTTFERAFYRLAGYRLLGQRAVRVDILERLADLIRPALAWKPDQGDRPDGAFDGRSFIVTPAMMSILGATYEDMEQILKSLGYRCEEKPAEEIEAVLGVEKEARPSEPAAAVTEPVDGAEVTEPPEAQESGPPAPGPKVEQPLEGQAASGPQASAESSEATGDEPATPAAEIEAVPGAQKETQPSEPAAAVTEPAESDGAEVAVPPEPQEPGPQPEPNPEAAQLVEGQAASGAPASAESSEATSDEPATPAEEEPAKTILLWRQGASDSRQRHRKRPRPGGRDEKPHEARRKGPRHKGGQNRQGRPKQGQPRSQTAGPPKIDPDSPFAKLAALKEQLKE